jgi:hypothetical protein
MSQYTQKAFNGGMNLLEDDTRLKSNEYRLALNLRNRFGKLKPVLSGVKDTAAPTGLKQELRTFGEFSILFVAGFAYYKHYTSTGWIQIVGFQMSRIAPRYWTEVVPVQSAKFFRKASSTDSRDTVTWDLLAGASNGNPSGLVVQDNINQPQLIYIDPTTLKPVARVLQIYAQWGWTESGGALTTDNREYVPIGNSMAWVDGVLYVTSQDYERLYRSVSGRPLDFVVNITTTGVKGGDAETTAYSVGVGGISCIRAMSSGALFVAASNANFAVSKNNTPGAPTLFGEYTFIRTFLFNATCLSDRAILDSIGDTRFMDLTGVRSFNAILQTQNEGRNTQFSANTQSMFENLVQSKEATAAILYDNYEFYAFNTVIGNVIGVYDTLTQSWVSFDTIQTGGSAVKQLAKIELSVQRLYAITIDNEVWQLYSGTEYAPILRTGSISDENLQIGDGLVPPNSEHKLQKFKAIFTDITDNMTVSVTPMVQNKITKIGTFVKSISYEPETQPSGPGFLPDVGTGVYNMVAPLPNCNQGCQTYCIISWTSGAELSQFSMQCTDIFPMNPLLSRS